MVDDLEFNGLLLRRSALQIAAFFAWRIVAVVWVGIGVGG